jgi:hypothetical protein
MPDLRPILSQKCRADVIRLSFWPTISLINKIGMDGFRAVADREGPDK